MGVYPLHQNEPNNYRPGSPEWIEAYIRNIEARQRAGLLPQQTGSMRPVRNTDKLLSPREVHRRKEWSEPPTQKQLPGLDWLKEQISQGLPVQKPTTTTPVQSQEDAPPLPTWLISPGEIESRISAALPPAPDDDAWLNDAHPGPMPTQEAWDRRLAEIATPPVLAPLPEDAIAATDRVAGNISYVRVWEEPEQTTSALEQLSALAKQPAKDDTLEVPTVMRKQHEKKESE